MCVKKLLTFIKNEFAPYIPWMGLFTIPKFILGVTEGMWVKLIDHLFMIIKRYIYITRCTEGILNDRALINYIRFHFNLERSMLVYKNGRGDIFENKWNPLYPILLSELGLV